MWVRPPEASRFTSAVALDGGDSTRGITVVCVAELEIIDEGWSERKLLSSVGGSLHFFTYTSADTGCKSSLSPEGALFMPLLLTLERRPGEGKKNA